MNKFRYISNQAINFTIKIVRILMIRGGVSALVNVIIVGGYVDANNLLTRGRWGSKNPDFMLTLFVHGP